jgi:hypothetical protein
LRAAKGVTLSSRVAGAVENSRSGCKLDEKNARFREISCRNAQKSAHFRTVFTELYLKLFLRARLALVGRRSAPA